MTPLPLIDGCLFVDNSFLELLTTCPRALEYNQLYKLVSAASKPPLTFGTAGHDVLEFRYVRYANELPTPVMEDEQATLLSEFYQRNPVGEGEHRNLNHAIEVFIRKYNERYAQEPFRLLMYDKPIMCPKCEGHGTNHVPPRICLYCNGTGERTVMCELPFAVPLYKHQGHSVQDITVIYTGRIDLPVMWDNRLFLIDHKTTSQLGPYFFEDKFMSAQLPGYAWAFEQVTKKVVHGVAINAIRTLTPTEKLLSSPSAAQQRWWMESYARDRSYIRPGQIEEWRTNAIDLCEEFFWHYSRSYMPMKTTWCVGRYGRCQYIEVCKLGAENRELQLSSNMFTHNDWSPLKEPKHKT